MEALCARREWRQNNSKITERMLCRFTQVEGPSYSFPEQQESSRFYAAVPSNGARTIGARKAKMPPLRKRALNALQSGF